MRYFPIFVDLEGASVLIVGGGEEALRKARLVAKTPARIHVVAADVLPELAGLAAVVTPCFDEALLDGVALVYVAEPELGSRVSAAARLRNIPVNVVDVAEQSTFLTPSIVDRDPVVVAIGTEGAAPVLGQHIRARVDALLPSRLGELARRAQGLRDLVAKALPHGSPRRAFWQRFFFGSIATRFYQGRDAAYAHELTVALKDGADASRPLVTYISTAAGNAELLTLKAQRRLMEADQIVHGAGDQAFLELARRDATRVLSHDWTPSAHRTVRLVRDAEMLAGEQARLEALGFEVEVLPAVAATEWPASAFGFRTRDDIVDHLLRAAS
jgi:uroporphyrin-III C-methyltransferase/precorrin-2 dehydrogenase/sirohydrochlorin ferrochelatase